MLLLGLFVDDMIAAYHGDDSAEWGFVKSKLTRRFPIKDLGVPKLILGMRVSIERQGRHCTLRIDHRQYIEQHLRQFGLSEAGVKGAATPEQVGVRLITKGKENKTRDSSKQHSGADAGTQQHGEGGSVHSARLAYQVRVASESVSLPAAGVQQYQSLVGVLQYCALSTRPDIAHAVSVLARYLQAPTDAHWTAAKRVLRYLMSTKHAALVYRVEVGAGAKAGPTLELKCFTDADWGGDLDDRRSTTGYVVQLNGCTMSWASVKQRTVALSTAEAEYMAISAGVQEVKWWQSMLSELGIGRDGDASGTGNANTNNVDTDAERSNTAAVKVATSCASSPSLPCTVLTDNQSSLAMCLNDVHHSRSKHISIRHHFIRECVRSGDVRMQWVDTKAQCADILTKALDVEAFERLKARVMGTAEDV